MQIQNNSLYANKLSTSSGLNNTNGANKSMNELNTKNSSSPVNLNLIPSAISFKASITKTPILDSIKNINDLYEITANPQKAEKFINEVTTNPRKSKEITKALVDKAGGKEPFIKWYFAKDGYKQAYSSHIEKLIDKAEKPEDLLKVSPNWGYWVFDDKFGKDFTFGEVPQSFENLKNYRTMVKDVLSNKPSENIKELSGGESGKRAFVINLDNKKYVLKVQNDFLVYSDALKEAMQKDSWLEDSFFKNYKENEAMKSDSCYLNAMIDSYLNQNNSENSLQIHLFDAKTGSVLYEYAEGESYDGDLNILNVNNVLSDLNNLGIIYNDVSKDNLKVKNETIKIIDSGESNFIDVLKPTVNGHQIELPNWSGNNYASLITGLNN